jgi:hypothetical protein
MKKTMIPMMMSLPSLLLREVILENTVLLLPALPSRAS